MAKTKLLPSNGHKVPSRKEPRGTKAERRNRWRMPAIITARQQLVLRLRFARDHRAATHEEVAEAMGVSRDAVRRLERVALRRLRLDAVNPFANCVVRKRARPTTRADSEERSPLGRRSSEPRRRTAQH